MVEIRRGQAPPKLSREVFSRRFRARFEDPIYRQAEASVQQLEELAWQAYTESRKAPERRAAGPGYADPNYQLSLTWLDAKARIDAARHEQQSATSPSRALLVCASARNDGTCPGEVSKTWRLTRHLQQRLEAASIEVDFLDLSLLGSEYGRQIHPCKGCLSTAMPLCHFPCSCYPNPGLGQTNDWMNELYERFTRTHAIAIITPVYWYQVPSGLKALIDRLVCADGGNPDPTSTGGKQAEKAKQLELAGWPYPKHLAGRAFGVVVHGDVAGTENVRRSLTDWLTWMGLVPAGPARDPRPPHRLLRALRHQPRRPRSRRRALSGGRKPRQRARRSHPTPPCRQADGSRRRTARASPQVSPMHMPMRPSASPQ